MENKEVMIVKQAVLKATVKLVGDKFKDNYTPEETARECLVMADILYAWVVKDNVTKKQPVPATPEIKDNPGSFEPKCPVCESFLWDNRESAKQGQPKWRCKNDDCTGGTFSKKFNKIMPWASWESDEFKNAEIKFKKLDEEINPFDQAEKDEKRLNQIEKDTPPF